MCRTNKGFHLPAIFLSLTLDAAADIYSSRLHLCQCIADILWRQATGENDGPEFGHPASLGPIPNAACAPIAAHGWCIEKESSPRECIRLQCLRFCAGGKPQRLNDW